MDRDFALISYRCICSLFSSFQQHLALARCQGKPIKSSRFNGFPCALKPLKRLKTSIPSLTPDLSRVLLKKAIISMNYFSIQHPDFSAPLPLRREIMNGKPRACSSDGYANPVGLPFLYFLTVIPTEPFTHCQERSQHSVYKRFRRTHPNVTPSFGVFGASDWFTVLDC